MPGPLSMEISTGLASAYEEQTGRSAAEWEQLIEHANGKEWNDATALLEPVS